MLDSGEGISDLIFSPGRPPQVERYGELAAVGVEGLPVLRPEDTAAIAKDLINENEICLRTLKDSVKADDVEARLKGARDQAVRALRDRSELFEDGGNVIVCDPGASSAADASLGTTSVWDYDTLQTAYNTTGSWIATATTEP